MTWRLFVMSLFFIRTALSFYDTGSDVKVLNKNSFSKFIKKNKLAVVEFYAPWCGHCKNLKPEYEGAAKALRGIVPLAAVDANEDINKELAQKYDVKGFPTLLIFQNGVHSSFNYRTKDTIIKGVENELSSKYLTTLSDENKDEFLTLKGKKAILFGKNLDLLYKSISMQHYKKIKFAFATKNLKSLVKKFNVKKFPKVVFFDYAGKNDFKTVEYKVDKLKSEISNLLKDEEDDFEALDVLEDNSCLQKHCVASGKLCIFYVETNDKMDSARRLKILQEVREDLMEETLIKYVKINAVENKKYLLELFGKKTNLKFPRVFAVSHKKRLYSAFRKQFTHTNLKEFLKGFLTNNPKSKINRITNEKIPQMGRRKDSCGEVSETIKRKSKKKKISKSFVIDLTDVNFEETIRNSKVPVFVEFYAPWCGFCKKFAPEYEKAANKLESTVLITRVDATTEANLAKRFDIRGYPTIKLLQIPLEKSKEVELEDFTGERSAKSVIEKSKAMLRNQSLVTSLDQNVKSFQKTIFGEYKGKIVFFVAEKKFDFIADATSLYFAKRDVKFYRLKPSSYMAKKMVNLVKEKLFVTEHIEKDRFHVHKYKNELRFADVLLHLDALFDDDDKAYHAHFDTIEKQMVEKVKEEL